MRSLHIGIAGAGLAGRCLAWRLAGAGHRVTLLDSRRRDARGGASRVAAAMLSPLAELAVSNATVFALGQRSMELWPQWIAELHAARSLAGPAQERLHPRGGPGAARDGDDGRVPGAPPVYYRQQGTLVVAHGPDQSSLDHFTRLLQHKLPAAHRAQVQALDAAAVAALEPALAGRFSSGLYLQGEGQLANGQWLTALAKELGRLGVVWHEEVAVHALEARRIRGRRVLAGANANANPDADADAAALGDETAQAAGKAGAGEELDIAVDCVVDARGVGSKPLLPGLRGVRGEVLRVLCPGLELQRPVRLMHPRYQLYVVPRQNHLFVVGATELESEDTGRVTLRSTLELGSALYSLHPAFGEARLLGASAALRPAFDNDAPACFAQDGIWHINGLYRHGYLCAPALVESLVQKMTQAHP